MNEQKKKRRNSERYKQNKTTSDSLENAIHVLFLFLPQFDGTFFAKDTFPH